jgi:hypothetical protein
LIALENTLTIVVVLLAPVGFFYAWNYYLQKLRKIPFGWRNGATLFSLMLVSLAVLLWPLMIYINPQMSGIEVWHTYILRICAMAVILSFLGRARLILPISIACIGVAAFWITGTMP